MSYSDDSIYKIIEQTRNPAIVENVVSEAWNQWSNWVRVENLRADLTHYRPFRGGRVTLKGCAIQRDTGEFLREIHFFLQIFSESRMAGARFEKEAARHRIPPPLFIPQLQAILWTAPNIPRLRKLNELMKHGNFRHVLFNDAENNPDQLCEHPPKLLRLVPRKRAVLTWDDPRTRRHYFVKLFNKSDAAGAAENFKRISRISRQEHFNFFVPEVINYNPSCRTLLMSKIPGENFTGEMRQLVPGAFSKIGRILAQLHTSRACPAETQSLEKELESIQDHMDEVKLVLPHLSVRLDTVMTMVEGMFARLSPSRPRPIHGNLFGDQILYGRNTIGIVDWDAFCCGDPLFDIGRLIAHFLFLAGTEGLSPAGVKRCVGAFLRAYQDGTGKPIHREDLNWHVTTQLLMRGKITALRKLPAGWDRQLDFVAQEAEKLARGRSGYLDLPSLATHE